MAVKAAGTSGILVHLHHIPNDINCQINDQFPPVPFISRNNIRASFYYFLSYSQKHKISEQNYSQKQQEANLLAGYNMGML